MIQLLEDLAETDTLIVLATNNFETAQDILAARYLESGLVHAIVNSALVGMRKPNPAYYSLILETFDLDPAHTLVIDDADTNLEVARDLEMVTVLVGNDTTAAVDEIRRLVIGA
ncbi:MAG: HAD-IA family hydrolase [Acidimicrobiales bacterium]